ncbi:hypothetical protein AAFF_G00338840 [Aldrovandia affinis]|uniref:LITAF domain-containing protein n=1 Tax=Aldrovandia affinis TaxID=143900 RepID=A0AAD7VZY0_9TELE|nr:hypothetical protein AAFF_G00338840 [Aldrovandia affinis]
MWRLGECSPTGPATVFVNRQANTQKPNWSCGAASTEDHRRKIMTSKGMDIPPATPPPYLIPAEGQSDVKVYNVHTPFNPPESTIQDIPYQVQTSHTYAAAQQPKQKFISYETEMGREPVMTSCPTCQTQVMSNVTYKVGKYAWLMCLLFIVCGLFCLCCLIPFFVKFFKDVYHSCPRCNRVLHVNKKTCC